MAKGLCETCGVGDSKGIPCYMMTRETAEVFSCGAYVKDEVRHAELVATKTKKGAGKEVSANG